MDRYEVRHGFTGEVLATTEAASPLDALHGYGVATGFTTYDEDETRDMVMENRDDYASAVYLNYWVEAVPCRFAVDLIEACDPEALPAVEGINVTVTGKHDTMSRCPVVEITGPSRKAVENYVRENWGDDDSRWFATWVVARIRPL